LLDWKSASDISGDGGVVKKVLAEGSGGKNSWQRAEDRDEGMLRWVIFKQF
jgi:hypothetical protein